LFAVWISLDIFSATPNDYIATLLTKQHRVQHFGGTFLSPSWAWAMMKNWFTKPLLQAAAPAQWEDETL